MQDINLSNKPLLSIIIPMYNCAPVITRCLDSIDYKECEIIVVNDGSTDNGAEIVSLYAETHPNVRIINKHNGGVSSARNLGIEEAKGKYISFIDADDYIVSGGLERIVKIAETYSADVVKFKNKNVYNSSEQDKYSISDFPINILQTTGEGVLSRYDISDYIVWDGIYRRSLIIDNNLRFMIDLCLREDDTFMGMLYCHADIVISTDLPLYRYVCGSNFSSTHKQSIEKQRKLIMSGLKAVRHRGPYVSKCKPQVMKLEKLKYMRWVCTLRNAISAQLTIKEYLDLLDEFRKEGVYPLDYAWIKAAGWDYAWKPYIKRVLQTFSMNHPRFFYPLAKWYYKN
jgi:glycosyltransferase involved in cell wall biosynthesis